MKTDSLTEAEIESLLKPESPRPETVPGMPADRLAVVRTKIDVTAKGRDSWSPLATGGFVHKGGVSFYASREFNPVASREELAQGVQDGELKVTWGWTYHGV